MEQAGVYILQNKKNRRYYIGSTNDIRRRLKEHNTGKVSSTNKLKPLILKAFIKCNNLTEAKSAEYRLKKYKRRDVLEKTIKDLILPWDYKQ